MTYFTGHNRPPTKNWRHSRWAACLVVWVLIPLIMLKDWLRVDLGAEPALPRVNLLNQKTTADDGGDEKPWVSICDQCYIVE